VESISKIPGNLFIENRVPQVTVEMVGKEIRRKQMQWGEEEGQ
jgi:hypothetical protein